MPSHTDAAAAIIDLAYMFVAYVAETEAVHGGDFAIHHSQAGSGPR